LANACKLSLSAVTRGNAKPQWAQNAAPGSELD
jgi:hypothetical protein